MDRAHRLGQKKVVNVYRFLMRGTLEERIMSLQRFKIDVANAVVNSDNVSTASMDTSGVIDNLAASVGDAAGAAAASAAAGAGDPGAQDGQYGDFDMSSFVKRVAGQPRSH